MSDGNWTSLSDLDRRLNELEEQSRQVAEEDWLDGYAWDPGLDTHREINRHGRD